MHAVSINQIADILHFNDKSQYPKPCLACRDLPTYVLLVLFFFQAEANEGWYLSLINQICVLLGP